jgi:hypothetical protein
VAVLANYAAQLTRSDEHELDARISGTTGVGGDGTPERRIMVSNCSWELHHGDCDCAFVRLVEPVEGELKTGTFILIVAVMVTQVRRGSDGSLVER